MKGKVLTAVISCLVTACILVTIFSAVLMRNPGGISIGEDGFDKKLNEINSLIKGQAVSEFDAEEAYEGLFKGYMLGFKNDKYAYYYSKEELDEAMNSLHGGFAGVGITFYGAGEQELEEGLLVYRVIGNSPAEKAGIKNGDVVVSVDGISLIGKTYNEAFDILSKEIQDGCKLKVKRGEKSFEFSLKAEDFTQKAIDYTFLEDGIAYVRIYQFSMNCADEFISAIKEIEKKGVKGYIFDVRYNPGGELETVCRIVDSFAEKGEVIAITEYKNNSVTEYSKMEPIVSDVPICVVMNESTASAAELFSSALRDLRGAVLVGKHSFGKGIGQTTITLNDGSAVKFTTFKYYTKSKTDYNGKGLVPDVEVDLAKEKVPYLYTLKPSEDEQLSEALKQLKILLDK